MGLFSGYELLNNVGKLNQYFQISFSRTKQ
jgi:hypothetical protein